MLTLTIQGTAVIARITVASLGVSFDLTFHAPNEWSARLLLNAMRAQAQSAMSAIRQEAYAEGWKDAKAKRAKTTWFSGRLP